MTSSFTRNELGQAIFRKTVPVGKRTDPVCPNSVFLRVDRPSLFGRLSYPACPEVDVGLLSKRVPLMISRRHATVAHDGEQWTVTDHNTSNGVLVNGNRIRPDKPHPIFNGDKVAFGCSLGTKPPEFEYVFENRRSASKRVSVCDRDNSTAKRCRVLSNVASHNLPSSSSCSGSLSDRRTSSATDPAADRTHDSRIKAEEERLSFLTQQLFSKNLHCNELQQRMAKNERHVIEEAQQEKLELEKERIAAQDALESLLSKKLGEKEQLLKHQFNEQINLLQVERQTVEERLQTELNRKLDEQDKLHQEELKHQKQALERILSAKETERANLEKELNAKKHIADKLKSAEEVGKQLEDSLDELKEKIRVKERELNKQLEVTRVAEELARKSVIEQMEDEFTCIICQELFIHAATLSCAHTFCKLCINSWMKKKYNCPVCRARVKGKPVQSVVLDSAVAKVVACLDGESRSRRDQIYEERVQQELSSEQASDVPHPSGSNPNPNRNEDHGSDIQIVYETNHQGDHSGSSHSYQRSSQRSGNLRGRGQRYRQSTRDREAEFRYERTHDHRNNPPPRDSMYRRGNHNNSMNSFSQPIFEAPTDNYFGGVGHCFTCGMRGHYARVCPFRHG